MGSEQWPIVPEPENDYEVSSHTEANGCVSVKELVERPGVSVWPHPMRGLNYSSILSYDKSFDRSLSVVIEITRMKEHKGGVELSNKWL